jgi:hypothetical protein
LRDRDATTELQVYSGQHRVGSLRRHDGGFEAFDLADHSLGVYPDMQTAAAAIPERESAA